MSINPEKNDIFVTRNIIKKSKKKSFELFYYFTTLYVSGLQEYIEAVSFYHYLKNKRLVTLDEVQKDLSFTCTFPSVDCIDNNMSQLTTKKCENKEVPDTQCKSEDLNSTNSEVEGEPRDVQVHVPPTEYILGLADLTGELMRLAVSCVGKGDLDTPFQVRDFLQLMQSGFVSFGYCGREIGRKLHTLRQSLQKVETACYTLQVRGSEIPKHMLVDVLSSGPTDYNTTYDHDTADD